MVWSNPGEGFLQLLFLIVNFGVGWMEIDKMKGIFRWSRSLLKNEKSQSWDWDFFVFSVLAAYFFFFFLPFFPCLSFFLLFFFAMEASWMDDVIEINLL